MHPSPNITTVIMSRRMRWAGHVARMRQLKMDTKFSVGKIEEKRQLGRLRHRWEENIRMDLGGKWWEGVDWIHLAQDRDQWQAVSNTVMDFRVP
jgi:hypothetical protein